jgi:uncharacterized cysteine cluster protein YcgN (CxxCxxCC family)
MPQSLLDLSDKDWENLCDGCGRCCLVKLQDEDTDEIVYTNVACEFFNQNTCRCTDYENRSTINPRCVVLEKSNLEVLQQMPFTCAYRLKYENRSESYDINEISVAGKVVSEKYIHDDQLPDHVVDWISTDRDEQT